jgi:hypothetical protein
MPIPGGTRVPAISHFRKSRRCWAPATSPKGLGGETSPATGCRHTWRQQEYNGDQAIDQLGKEPYTEERMDLILIIIILLLLFGGGFGYSRWGYGGGIGIGGILLIVLVVYLLVGHGRL